MNMSIYISINICIYIYIYNIYIHICTNMCIYTHMHIHTNIYKRRWYFSRILGDWTSLTFAPSLGLWICRFHKFVCVHQVETALCILHVE